LKSVVITIRRPGAATGAQRFLMTEIAVNETVDCGPQLAASRSRRSVVDKTIVAAERLRMPQRSPSVDTRLCHTPVTPRKYRERIGHKASADPRTT
jgi:hypothetical protein